MLRVLLFSAHASACLSNLTVKYKLIPPAGASGNYSIDGEFSGEFLVINEVPQAVAISPTSFTVEG